MGTCLKEPVDKLVTTGRLSDEELAEFLKFRNNETMEYLFEQARSVKMHSSKKDTKIWGRVPISNYCKNNCKICGLRRDNQFTKRYRMEPEQILHYVKRFADRGITTIYLESGEDLFFTETVMAELLLLLKKHCPRCKFILNVGDKSRRFYQHMNAVGATGCMILHGTCNEQLFKKVYPQNMSPLMKKKTLWELRECGYQVGSSILVGLPYQTVEQVIEDIHFIREFKLDYMGIDTFIPNPRTPFQNQRSGNGDMALYLMAILRLMMPDATIFSGNAIDVVKKDGRMSSLEAGADVFMLEIEDQEVLDRFGTYPRKNGRFSLPGDNIDQWKMNIGNRELGL